MRTFDESDDNSLVTRFAAQLETALLAQALVDTGGLPDERAKALLGAWLIGTFNGCVAGLGSLDRGILDWQPEGSGHRLVWYMSSGVVCPLARVYPQADGTWAALIVAGVRDGLLEAMAAAEWGVARLTSS